MNFDKESKLEEFLLFFFLGVGGGGGGVGGEFGWGEGDSNQEKTIGIR